MRRIALENVERHKFVVPQNFTPDEVLIADVIRETDRHHKGKPLTPVLVHVEDGRYVILGNIAAYLVAMQLELNNVPAMRAE